MVTPSVGDEPMPPPTDDSDDPEDAQAGRCMTPSTPAKAAKGTTRHRVYASDPALQRASAAMTAATLAAGLLTTSTYQAMYVPYVTSSDSAQPASDDLRHQMQQPIAHSARAYFAFRSLNILAFVASVLCVAFATFVLWQISTRGTYRPLLFRCAFGGLLVALLAGVGAALCGVLSFVDFSAGIVGSVFTGVVIVALFVGFGGCISVHPHQGKALQRGQTIKHGKPVVPLPEEAAEIKSFWWPYHKTVSALTDLGIAPEEVHPPAPAKRFPATRRIIIVMCCVALVCNVVVLGVVVGVVTGLTAHKSRD